MITYTLFARKRGCKKTALRKASVHESVQMPFFLPIYKKFYNLPIIYMEEYDEDLLEIITENADIRKKFMNIIDVEGWEMSYYT